MCVIITQITGKNTDKVVTVPWFNIQRSSDLESKTDLMDGKSNQQKKGYKQLKI